VSGFGGWQLSWTASGGGDGRINFDEGGDKKKGKLDNVDTPTADAGEKAYVQSRSIDMSGYSENARKDPTIIQMSKNYDALEAKQYQLESKHDELKQKLAATTDNTEKQKLIGQLTQNTTDSQANQFEAYKQKDKIEKQRKRLDGNVVNEINAGVPAQNPKIN
jgi:outer membrane murein-binding lipoprotein Lpp